MGWQFWRRDASGTVNLERAAGQRGGLWAFSSQADYQKALPGLSPMYDAQGRLAQRLLDAKTTPTALARCAVCERDARFKIADNATWEAFRLQPNWRETLVCECGLINRLRLALDVFVSRCQPQPDDPVYVTERLTPLYQHLESRFSQLTGSEFNDAACKPGEPFKLAGISIRHEDLTNLSFAADSFAYALSFDVLEHVPNYRSALAELSRVLRPGGSLLLTAPFDLAREQTLVRARIDPDSGEVVHLEPAEFHGDPVRADAGILCFYHFGWDLLEELRTVGFSDVSLLLAWDPARAYVGWGQSLILARKAL